MPEYLAPGVFVEEVSFRSKSIEGVSTTTTGFIGPCRYGPVTEAPDILTSLTEFERTYGDGTPLGFGADGSTISANYLRHAVASFFEEGGKRLYVSRVFRPRGGAYPSDLTAAFGAAPYNDGHGRLLVGGSDQFRIVARYPGAFGNLQVRFGVKLGPNVLGALPDPGGGGGLIPTLANLADGDVVWISTPAAALNTPATGANPPAAVRTMADLPLYVARRNVAGVWSFTAGVAPAGVPGGTTTFSLADFALTLTPGSGDAIRPVTLSLEVLTADGRSLGAWSGLPLEPAHKTAGVPDGIFDLFSLNGPSSAGLPIVLLNGSAAATNLIDNGSDLLKALDALSTGLDLKITQIEWDDAALYYPWVTVFDGVTRQPLNLPPSGFVAGIYARNDTERGVYKAPANEVVRGAIGFETLINTAQQEVLNPEGINCFRFFEGRGNRLWGARTISSDPEWKYVNLRRYFAYLERSIDKGTQWAVFEPNGEALWANVRATVRDFLVNEWANGALLGDKPEKAFFVRCDRSTMTQNDLDNGRLVCLVGVAPLKPAEFVIFRIGQWTADQKS